MISICSFDWLFVDKILSIVYNTKPTWASMHLYWEISTLLILSFIRSSLVSPPAEEEEKQDAGANESDQ